MAIRKQQEQFIHLVRLAWDLRMAGLSATVDLPRGGEPAVLIPGAKGPLKVMVSTQGADWFFTWGRGRDQRVRVLDADAFRRVREVAR